MFLFLGREAAASAGLARLGSCSSHGWSRKPRPTDITHAKENISHRKESRNLSASLKRMPVGAVSLPVCFLGVVRHLQGVSKRCRLSWLTNSALVYEPKCGGRGGVAGSQPMSTAVHRSPQKLWRSNTIFNLWALVYCAGSIIEIKDNTCCRVASVLILELRIGWERGAHCCCKMPLNSVARNF
jgi:hypothetical protein